MISVDVERSTRIHYCRELIKAGPAHHNRFFNPLSFIFIITPEMLSSIRRALPNPLSIALDVSSSSPYNVNDNDINQFCN
jgi:hypothetical protein